VKGAVVFGGNSRVLMQFADDVLQIYYVLEIVNSARTRVDIGGPLVIDLPRSNGAAVLEGRHPRPLFLETGSVTGPFAPGATLVNIGYRLAQDRPSLTLVQPWPAAFQQVTVGVQKIGALGAASPQFTDVRDVTTQDGKVFALGSGAALAPGTPLTVTLTNLPYHSPRRARHARARRRASSCSAPGWRRAKDPDAGAWPTAASSCSRADAARSAAARVR
jgi:hypothetical protein